MTHVDCLQYSGKDNPTLEQDINGCILEFINLITRKYLSDETHFRPIDFARTSQFLALDAITAIGCGRPFGFCANDDDLYDYIKTTERTIPVMILVGALPMLGRILTSPLFRTFVMPNPNDMVGIGKILG